MASHHLWSNFPVNRGESPWAVYLDPGRSAWLHPGLEKTGASWESLPTQPCAGATRDRRGCGGGCAAHVYRTEDEPLTVSKQRPFIEKVRSPELYLFNFFEKYSSAAIFFLFQSSDMEYSFVDSQTQWTRMWANSRRQWGAGRSGVLRSMGWQRVELKLGTKQ